MTVLQNPLQAALQPALRPPFGLIGGLRAQVIAALFGNSEQGAMYDPSDLSTLFQDSAGTTPVTADSQPVGRILDVSGNGNHATQATAADKPLSTNGRLRGDGVGDQMDFSSVTARFIAVACQRITDGPNSAAYVIAGATPGLSNGGTNASVDDVFAFDGTDVIFSGVDGTDALVITVNIIGSSGTLRVNGVEFTGTLNPIIVARLFNRTEGAFRFHGDIMGAVIRDTAATTEQVQLVEQYLAEKAGATLP